MRRMRYWSTGTIAVHNDINKVKITYFAMKKILFTLFILLMGMTSCLTETELVYREPSPHVYVYTYPYGYRYYNYGYPYAYHHHHRYKPAPYHHPTTPPAPQPPAPPRPKPQVPKATVRPNNSHSGTAGSMSGRRGGNTGGRR